MADNTLDILIRFGLSKEKAIEAQGEIAKLQTATEESGKASVKANEEGGAAAQKHTGHIQGMHRAIGFLGRQFGEIGHLAHFAFNPATLAVAALAVGIHHIIGKIKEYNDAIFEKAEEINKMWEDRAAAQDKAKTAANNYVTALGDIYTKHENIKQAETDEIKRLKELTGAWKAVFDAQEKAELLAAGGDKGKEAAIKAKYGEKKSALDIEAEAKEVEVKADTYRKAQAATLAAQKKSDAAAAAVQALPERAKEREELDRHIAEREKNKTLDKLQAAMVKAGGGDNLSILKKTYDQAQAYARAHPSAPQGFLGGAFNDYQKALRATADYNEEFQKSESDKKLKAKLVGADSSREAEAAKALGEEKKSKEEEDNSKHDWEQSAEALRIHRATRGQVNKIEDFGHPDEIIRAGGAAVLAERAGRKLTDQQKADEAAFERLATELGQHAPTVIAMLKSTTDFVATLNSEVKFAHARITQMAQR